MNRVIADNIWYKYKNDYYLMNLISFRRKRVTREKINSYMELTKKRELGIKLKKNEEEFYSSLLAEKQTLTEKQVETFEKDLESRLINNAKYEIHSITINLTYTCNFNCDYCYQRKYSSKNGILTTIKIDKIHDYIAFVNKNDRFVLEKIIIAGGEPLLNKNIQNFNYIINKFRGITDKIVVFTNGANIIKLKNSIEFQNIDEFQISIDGDDTTIKVLNKSKTANIDDIIDGVKYIAQMGKKIEIVTLITKKTLKNIDNLISKFISSDLFTYNNITFRMSHIIDYKSPNPIDLDFYNYKEYIELKNSIQEKILGTKYSIDTFYAFSRIAKHIRRGTNRYRHTISQCATDRKIPTVFGPNGGVYFCTCVEPIYGKIGEYYPSFKVIRENLDPLMNRNIFTLRECKKCIFRYLCLGGCPLYLIAKGHAYDKVVCQAYKNEYLLEHLEELIF